MNLTKLTSFALIAQLLAAPLTSGMLVLCFGSDGHVAVESAGRSLCCREWKTSHEVILVESLATTIVPASGPCCKDVELRVESARLTAPSQKVLPASELPRTVPVTESPLHRASAETFPVPTESPVAASLRTVVLRA